MCSALLSICCRQHVELYQGKLADRPLHFHHKCIMDGHSLTRCSPRVLCWAGVTGGAEAVRSVPPLTATRVKKLSSRRRVNGQSRKAEFKFPKRGPSQLIQEEIVHITVVRFDDPENMTNTSPL